MSGLDGHQDHGRDHIFPAQVLELATSSENGLQEVKDFFIQIDSICILNIINSRNKMLTLTHPYTKCAYTNINAQCIHIYIYIYNVYTYSIHMYPSRIYVRANVHK